MAPTPISHTDPLSSYHRNDTSRQIHLQASNSLLSTLEVPEALNWLSKEMYQSSTECLATGDKRRKSSFWVSLSDRLKSRSLEIKHSAGWQSALCVGRREWGGGYKPSTSLTVRFSRAFLIKGITVQYHLGVAGCVWQAQMIPYLMFLPQPFCSVLQAHPTLFSMPVFILRHYNSKFLLIFPLSMIFAFLWM